MKLGPHKDRERKSDQGGTWSKVFAVLLQAQFGDLGKRPDGCRDACGILLLTLVNYFIDFQCQETNFVSSANKTSQPLETFRCNPEARGTVRRVGPKAHIRRRFHSLYDPCGMLNHSSTTSYKSLIRWREYPEKTLESCWHRLKVIPLTTVEMRSVNAASLTPKADWP